jgi:hypothetical protein
MRRVLTFSRTFPAYHPKAGQPTGFVEKFWTSIDSIDINQIKLPNERGNFCFNKYEPKYHTIRSGNRWKVGDKFSPRVWSGKPYRSKQITIAPDTEVLKVWTVEIHPVFTDGKVDGVDFSVNGRPFFDWDNLATNDGLSTDDLYSWFRSSLPFLGQIICWNKSVKY